MSPPEDERQPRSAAGRRAQGACGSVRRCSVEDASIDVRRARAPRARLAGLLRAHGVESRRPRGLRPAERPRLRRPRYYGALRLGAIAVPLNPLLRPPEVADPPRACGRSHPRRRPSRRPRRSPGFRCRSGSTRPRRLAASPSARSSTREAGETAVHPLHLGHDGAAEGRRAHACRPARERRLPGRAAAAADGRTTFCWRRAPLHVFGRPGIMNPADRGRAPASRCGRASRRRRRSS